MTLDDIQLAHFASAAYTTPPTFHGTANNESIRAIVSEVDGGLVVAFPGSESLDDWLKDFLALPVQSHAITTSPHGWTVHWGFLLAANSVVEQVRGAVAGRAYGLTGHSLGGAIALLIGATFAAQGHPPELLTTFGAPRVGLGGYVDATRLLTACREYRFGNDVVPQVPGFLAHAKDARPIAVGAPRLDFISCHHMPNYLGAVTTLLQKAA